MDPLFDWFGSFKPHAQGLTGFLAFLGACYLLARTPKNQRESDDEKRLHRMIFRLFSGAAVLSVVAVTAIYFLSK